MSNTKTKEADKPAKQHKSLNFQAIWYWMEKSLAFVVLVVAAAYGFRKALEHVTEAYAFVITGIVIVLLVSALLRKR